jgi:hypothetical protein
MRKGGLFLDIALVMLLAAAVWIGFFAKPEDIPLNLSSPSREWQEMSLKDVVSGTNFKISDFRGSVVIIEFMATHYLPGEQQRNELVKVQQMMPEAVLISLDADLAEDESNLAAYVQSRNYTWRFAVVPLEMSVLVISQYGQKTIEASSMSLLILDKSGRPHLLRYDFKRADEIITEARKYA